MFFASRLHTTWHWRQWLLQPSSGIWRRRRRRRLMMINDLGRQCVPDGRINMMKVSRSGRILLDCRTNRCGGSAWTASCRHADTAKPLTSRHDDDHYAVIIIAVVVCENSSGFTENGRISWKRIKPEATKLATFKLSNQNVSVVALPVVDEMV